MNNKLISSKNTPLNKTSIWKELSHQASVRLFGGLKISDLLKDPFRRRDFTHRLGNLTIDISKTDVTREVRDLLLEMAKQAGIEQSIERMFGGEIENTTEKRAVLHVALRNVGFENGKFFSLGEIMFNGQDVMPDVVTELNKMAAFTDQVREGKWQGTTGKVIKTIVSIGIGGSDLGPRLAVDALGPEYGQKDIKVKFVSNVDPADISDVINDFDPETTMFIINSKSFTTAETMNNAKAAKDAFINEMALRGVSEDKLNLKKHFIAVSTEASLVDAFGMDSNNMFGFWDWVGGRYSLPSAIGLSVMMKIGKENFADMLSGYHEVDEHYQKAPIEKNIPLMLATQSVWHTNFKGYDMAAVLPYSKRLGLLPNYEQQLNMESNGKSATKDDNQVGYKTGPVIFGTAGTDGQHSYYQLLHQGTIKMLATFIGFTQTLTPVGNQHETLLSNMFAQAEALMTGLLVEGKNYKSFEGNRPSNTMLYNGVLTPKALGMLIALDEHKVHAEGVIYDINSFDQEGVQLGKVLAKKIEKELAEGKVGPQHDSSTAYLIQSVLDSNFKEEIASMIKDNKDINALLSMLNDPKGPQFWDIANALGHELNYGKHSEETTNTINILIPKIREYMGVKARTSKEPTTCVFGTSGWRGKIGEDFTVENVHKVARSIIDMMNTDVFLKENGYALFQEVKEHGIVVFRDNRFMGDEFMDAAMKELAAEGIKIYFAGECPTGVGSALVTELGAAGSLNFTPSHNAMDYAGLKFNPAHGGPADANITDIIMAKSVINMANGDFKRADAKIEKTNVSAIEIFNKFLEKSEIFDIQATREWLRSVKEDLYIVVDNMHGSSRGYVEGLLGEELLKELEDEGSIVFLNTNEDYSFHGVKPEPSAKNMKPLITLAKQSGRKFTYVCAFDPDADRIRFGTAEMDIDMNKFGALAYANLLERGLEGGVASTAPSSDFALKIAADNNQPIHETAVGFKYFGPYVATDLVAFEESDGITFKGHTREKDAIAGFLMGLDIMRTTGMTLDKYYEQLQEKYGYYICDKTGVDVKGVSVDEWQAYKKEVVDALKTKVHVIGDKVMVGEVEKTIKEINTIDGLKVIFDDGSWLLARPSGTEPKFRIYGEVTSKTKPTDAESEKMLNDIFNAGKAILTKAREIADNK